MSLITLGVLVPERRLRRLYCGEFSGWIDQARDAECRCGVRSILLSPHHVDLTGGEAAGLSAAPGGWQVVTLDTPPHVFFNRLVLPSRSEGRALRDLNGARGLALFNETNRWNRGMVHEILRTDPDLHPFVPEAHSLTGLVGELAETPGWYLLTPSRRSVREGGVLLKSTGKAYFRYVVLSTGAAGELGAEGLAPLERSLPYPPRWLIPLSGEPQGPAGALEWRLYLYRTHRANWTVAGGVAKREVLRGARRERCWRLLEALTLTFGAEAASLYDRLYATALTIVERLSLFVPGIAHCAVDFWIDAEGRPFFLDLAGQFRLDWLRRAGEQHALELLLQHPARFARHLVATGGEKLHVGFPGPGRPSGPSHHSPPGVPASGG